MMNKEKWKKQHTRDLTGKVIIVTGGLNEMNIWPVRVESDEASHDVEDAQKLWDFSEKITHVRYLS